jgi:hypothetical protein
VARTNTGPGRAQRKGRSAAGRTTTKGGPTRSGDRVGRYRSPEETGRYTPPTPRNVRQSPRWLGVLVLVAFALGVLTILLNYLSALPGSVSVWYLVAGLVLIFGGFLLATRYH